MVDNANSNLELPQLMRKHVEPDREPGRDVPYGSIENLRPETKALVATMVAMKPKKK